MDRNALESRLENWARAQRSGGASPARASSAEGWYVRPGVMYRDTPDVPLIDHADALVVNNAWQRLMDIDKRVLMMHYVRRASPMVILRELKLIRTAPKLHDAHVRTWLRARRVFLRRYKLSHDDTWDYALYHAQSAIWHRLEKTECSPFHIALTA